jgi:UDP-N-acetyl-D-glucosamine dehydrogenase
MATDLKHMLEEKLINKTAVIGVVGLGYVGLPLSTAFAETGFRVLAFDVQQSKVDLVNKGESYIADIESKRLSEIVRGGRLSATSDQSRIADVDALCICVPTPLTKTKDPDLSYVVGESKTIAKYLKRGQLIILESTTYPGTTRDLMLPILESSGLKAGMDFYLAFSPERVDPGSKKYTIRNTPKVVGGIDSRSTELASLLYRQVADTVIPVSCPEVAELTKVFENVFRDVNIALVNELTLLCEKMGISVWEVIDTSATKPFGFMPFYPGPGVGGHCIPLDPYYLAHKAREYDFHTRFIELAAEVNEKMPYYVVSRLMDALNSRGKSLKDARIIVLGVTYKKDISDIRESPALKLVQLLHDKGADVCYNDPHVPRVEHEGLDLESQDLTDERVASADCLVIATDHTVYNYADLVAKAALIFDARGATRRIKAENVIIL